MTAVLALRGLQEYARRPLNLVLLFVVPVVFVIMSAGALVDFADALNGDGDQVSIEAASAGWAAAVLAGVAGFFHVSNSREPDRRLAAAGTGTWRVVLARGVSALLLAALAATGALAALWLRAGLNDIPTAIGATTLFALIYLGIGMAVGALVRSDLNGSLLIIFLWIFDAFLSPAMGISSTALRVFPLHFPTIVVTDMVSGHSGPLGDLGISLAWAAGSIVLALVALVATTRPARTGVARRPGAAARLLGGLRYGFREYRRNTVLWVLLAGMPVAFISASIAVTPDDPAPVELVENAQRTVQILSMSDLHGAIMLPITVAFLAGLAGLFVVSGSEEGDRRLVLTSFRAGEVLTARLGVIAFTALLTTGVSLTVTSADFTPNNWTPFILGSLLVALTYGMLGVLLGPVFGRLGGLYVLMLLPFVDLGIAQNPMLDLAPPAWATFMPAHGAVRVLLDGAFTADFDETGALLLAIAWLAAITVAAAVMFRRIAAPSRV